MNWKVGDKFTLPNNSFFPEVYIIIEISDKHAPICCWAMMKSLYSKEKERKMFSTPEKMRRATKLEQVLK